MVYSNVQLVLGAVYLLIMLLSSLVCGYSFSLTRIDKDRRGLFAIGFSLTPCVVGTWMMLFSFFPDFGHKQVLCILFYLILLLVSFVLMQNNLKCDFAQLLNNKTKINITFVCWLICILVFFIWCSLSICGFQINYDASFYMSEALKYVNTMSFHDIATHRDYIDNTLPGSPHNFLWPGYLAFGLLFTENGEHGLMHDISVYFAFILAGIYLIVALWGAIFIYVKNLKIACVASLFLYYSTVFFYLIRGSSRDNFRCIPIVILLALLYLELNNDLREKRDKIIFYLSLAFTCYFLMGGHPINAFTGAIIGLIWIILSLLEKKEVGGIVKGCLAMALGVFLGSYNFVYALIDTGKLSGNCSLYARNIYRGTPILEIYNSLLKTTMVTSDDNSLLLQKIFASDTYRICIIAFVISILLFFKYVKCKKLFIMPILVYLCSFLMIFVGKNISWSDFSYAEWLSRNYRYTSHFYVLAIICLGIFIFELSKMCNKHFIFFKKFNYSSFVTIVLLCYLTTLMLRSFDAYGIRQGNIAYYKKNGKIVYDLYSTLPEGEYMIIADNRWAYLTGVNAKVLGSYFGVPLFKANGKEIVWKFFIDNHIRYVFLNSPFSLRCWKDASFYKAIFELRDMGMMSEVSTNTFRINGNF